MEIPAEARDEVALIFATEGWTEHYQIVQAMVRLRCRLLARGIDVASSDLRAEYGRLPKQETEQC